MSRDWRAAPDDVAPTVLILGGFITSPPMYGPLRRRLLQGGAAGVVIAPVWPPDWLLVPMRGLGPILTRSGRALLEAGALSAASPRSGGAPLLVVGHSAGGITARLLTSPEPVAGRRMGAAGRIGAIVTLGTPHRVASDGIAGRRLADSAIALVDRVVPGAFFAPTTGYLTVASRANAGRSAGSPSERLARRLYASIDAGAPVEPDGTVRGDGLVPVASAGLPGVGSIVLDAVVHGQGRAGPWYGSDEALDVWWPHAMAVWHAAMRARVGAPVL